MQVEKIYTKYLLEKDDFEIYAKISADGITLRPTDGEDTFEFTKSDPKTIEIIADLMKKAVELRKKKEITKLEEELDI